MEQVGHRQLSQDSKAKLDLTAGRLWGQGDLSTSPESSGGRVTYLPALSPGPYQQGGGVERSLEGFSGADILIRTF